MENSDVNSSLSNEELLRLYRSTNNRKYLNLLFANVENLVYYACSHTSSGKKLMTVYKLSLEEVKSIAFLGVSKIINTYSFERNIKFSTAMYSYIIREFHKSFDYYNRKNRELNLDSLQGSCSQRDDFATPVAMSEQLKDETIDIEEHVLDEIEYSEYSLKLNNALEVMSERSKFIIHEYFYNNKTNADIAKVLNFNANSVSRLKIEILKELKKMIIDPEYIEIAKTHEKDKSRGVLRNLPKDYKKYTKLLSDKEKKALNMRLNGKTYEEIGKKLSIHQGTVGSILTRVVNKLGEATIRDAGKCKTKEFYETLYKKYPKYLNEISLTDQRLLEFKYKENKKYSEIAKMLDKKETAVCVLIRNAEYRFGNVIMRYEEI
jgi:RNA polymerase sigma factor (sigma-70 family)